MIDYLLIKPNGTIFQRGSCPTPADIPVVPGTHSEIVTKEDLRGPAKPAAPTYEKFRAMEYPAIGEQLDALWKLIGASGLGDKHPDTRAMLDKVNAVKTRYPKGTV